MRDIDYMALALSEARLAAEAGEIPVGAVLVTADGEVLRSRNDRDARHNPLGHAEVNLIVKATELLGDWRLNGCTLYVTMEPCPMCSGLILQCRIKRVVYGMASRREGCAGSVVNLLDYPGMSHHVEVCGGLLAESISALMQEFFQKSRT